MCNAIHHEKDSINFDGQLKVTDTKIEGLKLIDLEVHGDVRGWFKENWQQEKMSSIGLPNFKPVQNNISFNANRGVTRGIHAEPWNKFISVGAGRIFCAWVDIRANSSTYGQVFCATIDPSKAVYVPRGVGNSFQALEDNTVYSYLVDAHWSIEQKKQYTFVNLTDPSLDINWPIPLDLATLSDADKTHPMLADIKPMKEKRTLVIGSGGQLGKALRNLVIKRKIEDSFDFLSHAEFDISDPSAYSKIDWSLYKTVINCAAYTAVDAAQTTKGRCKCWQANATGPSLLAKECEKHNIVLVHISSDYVFDGQNRVHLEDEPMSPLGVYGQAKAAADLSVSCCSSHYIIRTSWVVGEGNNFVEKMISLSQRIADENDSLLSIKVINDQFGRLTFADDLAAAILHILDLRAPYGTYNCSNCGEITNWTSIAKIVFDAVNNNSDAIEAVSSEEYYLNANTPVSPRPTYSTLDLSKLESYGFCMPNWEDKLKDYISKHINKRNLG